MRDVWYFRCGDSIARVSYNRKYYEVAAIEVSRSGRSARLFYLERCREPDTLCEILLRKGIRREHRYIPSSRELALFKRCFR